MCKAWKSFRLITHCKLQGFADCAYYGLMLRKSHTDNFTGNYCCSTPGVEVDKNRDRNRDGLAYSQPQRR